MAVEQIGIVKALNGQATALSAQGENRDLVPDAPVFQDDTITTPPNSSIELQFTDGTIFAQGSDSEMLLDEYVYNASAGTGELLFNLAKGSLRAVSGEIVNLNPNGFNVETPLSTVGIRGTAFFVLLNPEGQVVGVEQMDPAHVVEVATGSGTATIATAGNLVAVQLDGFISDPTAFSPQFLEGIRNLAPVQGDPQPGDNGDPDGDPGGDQGDAGQEGDIPQEVLDNLTAALQLLQDVATASEDALEGVLGDFAALADSTGDGSTDTAEELQTFLDNLQSAIEALANGPDLEDLLDIPAVQAIVNSFDIKALEVDTDGTDYSAQISGDGYTLVTGTGNDDGVTEFPGTAGMDAYLGLAGNDEISGAASSDVLFGGSGTDTLSGGDGADVLYGGADADTIAGNLGSDYLIGGGGADSFKYHAITDVADTIRDFSHTDGDKVLVSDTAFNTANFGGGYISSGWTTSQNQTVFSNGLPSMVYDSANGQVWFDGDGNGTSSTPFLVCTFEGAPQDVQTGDFDHFA